MAELSPLSVLLTVMRKRWDANDFDGAAALAKAAAPYLHGKAPAARAFGDVAGVPDEDLEEWSGAGGTESEEADTGQFE